MIYLEPKNALLGAKGCIAWSQRCGGELKCHVAHLEPKSFYAYKMRGNSSLFTIPKIIQSIVVSRELREQFS